MTAQPDDALAARSLVAERSLRLSTTLAALGTLRGQLSDRVELLHGGRHEMPPATPTGYRDLLLAPTPPDDDQALALACSSSRHAIAGVRQRSLADFLG